MSKDNTEDPKSKIMSLADRRKRKSEQVRKTYMPLEQRVAELETDMVRVIDSLSDLDQLINQQARISRLLVRAVSQLASRVPDPESSTPKK
jgi:uncharacterized coiled-coil protein SlyX